MDTAIPIVKILLALALVAFVHMALLPYFRNPEAFFIERLRRDGKREVTHAHLLVRAFVGVGLACSGVWALGAALAFSVVLDVSVSMWLAITSGGCVTVGTCEYIRLRLFKYRAMTLDESSDPGRSLFTLRETEGEKARWLRTALIIAFFALIAVSLMQLLAPFGR